MQTYKNVKLPDDPALLSYYMQQATILKLDPKTAKVSVLFSHYPTSGIRKSISVGKWDQ